VSHAALQQQTAEEHYHSGCKKIMVKNLKIMLDFWKYWENHSKIMKFYSHSYCLQSHYLAAL